MTADTPQVSPLEDVMPTVETLAPTIPSFISIEDAVSQANSSSLRQSGFQYDAGDIENLNVTVQPIRFNGSDHTEVRLKLTSDAKTALLTQIKREGDKSGWEVVKGVAVVDKKTGLGSQIKFSPVPSLDEAIDKAHYIKRGTDDNFVAIGLNARSGNSTGTFTRYYPDGTAIRLISDPKDLYAFDGMVRVMIPGKATPKQIQEAMAKLGISANRVPTMEDVERFKVNKVLALLKPEYKTTSKVNTLKDFAQRRTMAESILKNYGATLDDVVMEVDTLGEMRFFLPERVALKIADEAKVGGFRHSMNNITLPNAQAFVDFIMEGHLLSSTTRFQRGKNVLGISSHRDLATGGGDYVFLSPFKKGSYGDTNARHSHTIYFKPESILKRTDWYAWKSDKYGVINPLQIGNHFENEDVLDYANWIKELRDGDGGGELMIQHALSLEDAEFIYVPNVWRDEILRLLKIRGKTTIGGRAIEDVIVSGPGGLSGLS